MKRTNFFKSLLLAAGLMMGVNGAWADAGDVTTNVDIDFSNDISGTNPYTINGTVGKMTWTQQWTMAPSVADGVLRFGNFNGGTATLENNTIGAKDVVTISFDLAFGKLGGKHVGFDFKDTDGNTILTQLFDAYNGDFDDNNPLNLDWANMYRGSNTVIQERCVYFTITLDYATKKITTKTKCYLSGAGRAATEAEVTVTMPSDKPLGAFVLTGNINNADRYSTLDNLKITTTEGDYSAATADFTVNWVCDGNIVKTETRSGDVDASVTLLASDTESFFVDDQKYIYVSDDASTFTVNGDGSTVVTITVRKAEIFTYYVKAFEGSTELMTISTNTVVEGETASYGYPQYIAVNGVLYKSTAKTSNPWWGESYTITENNSVRGFQYSREGNESIVFCSEAEDIEGLEVVSGGNTDIRASNRKGAYAITETKITTLEPGIYRVFGATYGNAGITFTLKAGDATVFTISTNGNPAHTTGDYFLITEPTNLMMPAAGNGGSSPKTMDYIIVQKAGEYYESMSIVGDFSDWDATKGIKMTRTADNPFEWTAVVKNYTITSSKYSYNYKAVGNEDYTVYELPSGDENNQNYDFNYDGAREGMYTLTFTVNTQQHSVEMSIEKQKTATIYFINTGDWAAENIKAYVWNDSGNNGWPGETMTATGEQKDGKDVYTWSTYALDLPTMIIISNNGSDTERTGNQPFMNGATYKAGGSATVSAPIAASGYGTFASPYPLDLTNVEAYKASALEGNVVKFEALNQTVPANTGILVAGTANGTVDIPVATEGTTVSGNVFEVNTTGTTFDADSDYNYFGLLKSSSTLTFGVFNPSSVAIPASKAYLKVSKSAGARLTFSFEEDTTTGIDNVNVNLNDTKVYNLNGQVVNTPQKGLYIVNGKKFINK